MLSRTCEKHTEHMDQLDNELEQQMQRLEARVRKEVRLGFIIMCLLVWVGQRVLLNHLQM